MLSRYHYGLMNRGGKLYYDSREPLNDAAHRAGINGSVKLHQLRHAFYSHALMSGIDPRTVQKWMGHKDLKTTLRDAHVSPDHEKAAIEQLNYGAPDSGDMLIRDTA
jgi:site-specific recombinase XerD